MLTVLLLFSRMGRSGHDSCTIFKAQLYLNEARGLTHVGFGQLRGSVVY